MKEVLVTAALKRGLAFLGKAQQSSGSFPSYTWEMGTAPVEAQAYATPFPTSLIAEALSTVESTDAKAIREKASHYLQAQRSPNWAWNYWEAGAKERKTLPYPDDLDDTACALTALFHVHPHIVTGEVLGAFVKILTTLEVAPGGPYNTWLLAREPGGPWEDTDLVVNANVAYFLQCQGAHVQGVDALLSEAIKANIFISKYYPNYWVKAYFVARVCPMGARELLRTHLLASVALVESPLQVALLLSSLVRLGVEGEVVTKLCGRLIEEERQGQWGLEGVYMDPAQRGKPYIAGSVALTTAFCVEALNLAQGKRESDREVPQRHPASVAIEEKIASVPAVLQPALTQIFTKVTAVDTRTPLFGLADCTYEALGVAPDLSLSTQLGAATAFGWMAYTIYDDFLDGEGELHMLPAANMCLREMSRLFAGVLPNSQAYQLLVAKLLDTVDAASSWEVAACQLTPPGKMCSLRLADLPDYADGHNLAERSIAHALAPLAVLVSTGNEQDVPALLNFFTHFLHARQLNDDAHDWREDFTRGRVSIVVDALLRHELQGRKTRKVSTETCMKNMQRYLWEHEIEHVCDEIEKALVAAEKAMAQCTSITVPGPLSVLLKPLYGSLEKTRSERQKTLGFLDAFSS